MTTIALRYFRVCLAGLFLGIAFWAAPALAADEVNLTTNFYTVSGKTWQEVMASLQKDRPWTNGFFNAYTEWRVDWNYQAIQSEAGHRVNTVSTKTRIKITFPRWQPPADAEKRMVENWSRFAQGLMIHEQGHARMALSAAAEVRKQVSQLPAAASAGELRSAVRRTASEAIRKYEKMEIAYDRQTRHGVNQSAWRWP